MVEMVKLMQQWVVDVIKLEKNKEKAFQTREKAEIICRICYISKRYFLSLRKDNTEDAF